MAANTNDDCACKDHFPVRAVSGQEANEGTGMWRPSASSQELDGSPWALSLIRSQTTVLTVPPIIGDLGDLKFARQ